MTFVHVMDKLGAEPDEAKKLTYPIKASVMDATFTILVRCMKGYDSIERLRVIFKMH